MYAYLIGEQARHALAAESAFSAFLPDLNSMQPEDTQELKGKRELSRLLFEEWYKLEQAPADVHVPEDVRQKTWDTILQYRTHLRKDKESLLSFAKKEFDTVSDMVFFCLQSILLIKREAEDELNGPERKRSSDFPLEHFFSNPFFEAFASSKSFQQKKLRTKKTFTENSSLPARVWREKLSKDELFKSYCLSDEQSIEHHADEIIRILKEVMIKSDAFQQAAEEIDLYWEFDQSIVRSLAGLALKEWKGGKDLEMPELSPDWEADLEFFLELCGQTMEKHHELDELLQSKLTNWKLDRITTTDEAILKLALTEMMIFPSIPVKVTINEYIDLSKQYSTPKSKQFINGMLDVMTIELKSSGKIRKSGRGLIDNK
jgi:transcription antitermination protein NusB